MQFAACWCSWYRLTPFHLPFPVSHWSTIVHWGVCVFRLKSRVFGLAAMRRFFWVKGERAAIGTVTERETITVVRPISTLFLVIDRSTLLLLTILRTCSSVPKQLHFRTWHFFHSVASQKKNGTGSMQFFPFSAWISPFPVTSSLIFDPSSQLETIQFLSLWASSVLIRW